MKKVLVAGASGFIGKALLEKLLSDTDAEIVALSREVRASSHPRVTWRKCDLFSLKELQEAMVGCDSAFYLVHSMLPSAALSQGTFYDFDLIIADNFARAAKQFQLKKMIYLGGMIPPSRTLSWHLRSRLEVEKTFRASTVPVIALRAGLIIGPGGSSFTILQRLVERLPLLVCPAWTKTHSQPLALSDAVRVLLHAFKEDALISGIFDVGGKEVVTCQELILRVETLLGKKRKIFTLNLIPLWLSRFWVMLITSSPKNLVYPLVLSLKHEMVVDPVKAWPFEDDIQTSLDESLRIALRHPSENGRAATTVVFAPPAHVVRSIQRLPLPPGKDAAWVAAEYFRWLPSFLSGMMGVAIEGNRCVMYLFSQKIPLMILEKSEERSSSDRQLLYIVGGLLKIREGKGRLEFREVLDRKYVMSAIHNFQPRMPWFLYKYTQALFHIWVMKNFAKHLKKQKN